jgi:hypothetical protein
MPARDLPDDDEFSRSGSDDHPPFGHPISDPVADLAWEYDVLSTDGPPQQNRG